MTGDTKLLNKFNDDRIENKLLPLLLLLLLPPALLLLLLLLPPLLQEPG
jgi:hypothetical protein